MHTTSFLNEEGLMKLRVLVSLEPEPECPDTTQAVIVFRGYDFICGSWVARGGFNLQVTGEERDTHGVLVF